MFIILAARLLRGLSAKLIIDIAVDINEFNDDKHCVSLLERLGYFYKGTLYADSG